MIKTSFTTQQISEKLLMYLRGELDNPDIDYAENLKQLQGGYETAIYRFQLTGVGDEYSHPLVLRLYPQFYGSQNAIWESKVQNALADTGYPVPRAHFIYTELSLLGGAFFIMDYLPGQILMSAPLETVITSLGKTQAELHQIDPARLIAGLAAAGIHETGYRLDSRFENLRGKAQKFPWVGAGIDWLLEHRPPEPARLSICHGDFHPLNILFQDGAVTGVLDWAGFAIGDPAFDVANTLVLITIPVKHLIELPEEIAGLDWDFAAEQYLLAYQQHRPLDRAHLDYYRVRRCVRAFIEGAEGQIAWQHPLVVQDLITYIHKITGLQIDRPS